jgi:hypothetical protein
VKALPVYGKQLGLFELVRDSNAAKFKINSALNAIAIHCPKDRIAKDYRILKELIGGQ